MRLFGSYRVNGRTNTQTDFGVCPLFEYTKKIFKIQFLLKFNLRFI